MREPLSIWDGLRRYKLVQESGLNFGNLGLRALPPTKAAQVLRRCVQRDQDLLRRIQRWRGTAGAPLGRKRERSADDVISEVERGLLTLVTLPSRRARSYSHERPDLARPTSPSAAPAGPIAGADAAPTVSVSLTVLSFEGDCPPLSNLPLHVDHRDTSVAHGSTDASGELAYRDLPLSHAYSVFSGKNLEGA